MLFGGMFWFFPVVIRETIHNQYLHHRQGQLLRSFSQFTPNLLRENQSEQFARYQIV